MNSSGEPSLIFLGGGITHNSVIDAAMDDIKKGMLLLRQNEDSDSILFWEALLEVNRALAKEDTERAIRYLKELLQVPILSNRFEFREICAHITDAYERVSQSGRNLEDMQTIGKVIERKYGEQFYS